MGTRLGTVLFRWFAVHMTCEWPVRWRTDIIRHIHLHIKDEPDGRRNTTLKEQRAARAGLESQEHNVELVKCLRVTAGKLSFLFLTCWVNHDIVCIMSPSSSRGESFEIIPFRKRRDDITLNLFVLPWRHSQPSTVTDHFSRGLNIIKYKMCACIPPVS